MEDLQAKPDSQGKPSRRMEADIVRALGQIQSSFNPLHKDCALDFHVSEKRNGFVVLQIALPEGMTRVFVALLESLHGLFRCMDQKARVASFASRPVDPLEIECMHEFRKKFQSTACSLFDGFINQGLPRNEAVKRTNAALKSENHPWANHASVTDILRASGRFRARKGSKNL